MSWSMTPQFVFSFGLFLLAGYLFGRVSYYRRFTLEHLTVHQQSFNIFGYAVVLYLLSWVVYWKFVYPEVLTSLKDFEKDTQITIRAIIGVGLALSLGIADNLRVLIVMSDDRSLAFEGSKFLARMRMAAIARYVNKSDDESLRILFRATLLKKLLMVTLSNDKVYVGYVTRYPANPTKQPSFLRLVPHSSGYRDEKMQVYLPVRYDQLRDRIELKPDAAAADGWRGRLFRLLRKTEDRKHPLYEDSTTLKLSSEDDSVSVDLNDFGMVIPWSDICTMTIYNEDIYEAFNPAKDTK